MRYEYMTLTGSDDNNWWSNEESASAWGSLQNALNNLAAEAWEPILMSRRQVILRREVVTNGATPDNAG